MPVLGQTLLVGQVLPIADWWMGNLGPQAGLPLDPHGGRGLAWLRNGDSGGPSALVPCYQLMSKGGGKIPRWRSCRRIVLIVQFLQNEVRQCWLDVMYVYGASTSAHSIHHLVGISGLQDLIRPHPYRESIEVLSKGGVVSQIRWLGS